MESSASTLQLLGAGGFGALIGWYIYYVIRHRTDSVSIADVGSLVGVIGGGAVLTLFPAKSDLFGAYGVGLFVGFFGYFLFLLAFVSRTQKFGVEWFLDGRRKELEDDEVDSGNTPMSSA
jgi:NADH:ubiquinone oxidoreductase subunit 4 (subunit M)